MQHCASNTVGVCKLFVVCGRIIEKSLEEEDKAEDQKRGEWVTWVVQTIGQVILVSTLMYIGQNVFGIGVVG